MKRFAILVLAAAFALTLAACGETEENKAGSSAETSAASSAKPTAEPSAAPENNTAGSEEFQEPAILEGETVPLENDPYIEYLSGDWYGELQDVVISLKLNADGSYTLTAPHLAENTIEGSWTYEGGEILLDGGTDEISVIEDSLFWGELSVTLSREVPETYVPGDVAADTEPADFNGYWVSLYADLDGYIVPSFRAGDETDIYVEAPMAALGGPMFGDIVREFSFAEGALVYEAGSGDA
ncbi:MAG: hypothetical protein IKD85_00570, partial [Firmicutes bacterium]|nr:hypothetical protein [Bacillota bacterium]